MQWWTELTRLDSSDRDQMSWAWAAANNPATSEEVALAGLKKKRGAGMLLVRYMQLQAVTCSYMQLQAVTGSYRL